MLQTFSKLSLTKLGDKTTKMEDNIPCNQKVVYLQEDDELDLTVKLKEESIEM
jgi:hypothetical protein